MCDQSESGANLAAYGIDIIDIGGNHPQKNPFQQFLGAQMKILGQLEKIYLTYVLAGLEFMTSSLRYALLVVAIPLSTIG